MQLHNWREKYEELVNTGYFDNKEAGRCNYSRTRIYIESLLIEQDKATRSACAEVARDKICDEHISGVVAMNAHNSICEEIALSLEGNGGLPVNNK